MGKLLQPSEQWRKDVHWSSPGAHLATTTVAQYFPRSKARTRSYQLVPDIYLPGEDSTCLICRKLFLVLTNSSPLWFELGTPTELIQADCAIHKPIIEHCIATTLIPDHVKNLNPVNLDENSPIHVSRHVEPTSLLVFQEGRIHRSFLLLNERPEKKPIGAGKIIDPEWIDIDILNAWRQQCELEHGDNCRAALSKTSQKPFLERPQLLIDTWRMCLTEVSQDDKYIALSYVWGNCTAFRTCKKNLAQLKEDQSLARAIQEGRIPKTLVHAIYLVGALKERYLWVDALCIVQDDDASKHHQFDSMASIYANSALTIIAAEGNDADYGIRGLRNVSEPRDSQQHVFNVNDEECRVIDTPWPLTFETVWFGRGWTYQEWLFPPKLLVFGDKRVRWECQQNHWQEDVDHQAVPNAAPFPIGPDTRSDSMGLFSSFRPKVLGYTNLVRFYNKREFTYDEDVLSAFAGITSLLTSKFDGGFLYGLPEMFFDVALLWIPFTEVTRRANVSPGVSSSRIPSWSWMGWRGEIDGWSWHSAEAFLFDVENGGVVTFPIVNWSTGLLSTQTQDRRAVHQSGTKYGSLAYVDDQPTPQPWTRHKYLEKYIYYTHPAEPDLKFLYPLPIPDASTAAPNPEQTPFLFGSAPRAWLYAVQDVEYYRPGVSLRSQDGSWAGFLNLHDFETMHQFSTSMDGAKTVELIAISYGFATEGKTYQIDELKLPHGPDRGSVYRFFNVISITWEDGIAYRHGVGRVLEAAWASEPRDMIDVTLG